MAVLSFSRTSKKSTLLLNQAIEICFSDYFGIPKTDTKVESIHLLFSVYVAIKNSRAQNTTVLATDNSS